MDAIRRLRLRRETLTELAGEELERVGAGAEGDSVPTVLPVRSCLLPCPTDPRFTCFCTS
jgi:hypothetical protein